MKKHKPTPEEIRNDPSLKFHSYNRGEAIWSDVMKSDVRFSHYDKDGKIVLMDMMLREIGAHVDPLTVRRHSIEHKETEAELKHMLEVINVRKFLARIK